SGEAYIRVMSEDMYGNLFFSPVQFLECPLDGITIFPSPAKQSILISSLTYMEQVELFDLEGRVIQSWRFNNNRMELNLDNHPPGMYIVQATMENGSLFQSKLMIGD